MSKNPLLEALRCSGYHAYLFEDELRTNGYIYNEDANGRYVINPRIAVWAKAGNLLGQSVQRYFLHPEKGPYGTLGISFNL